jgi:regulator of cell morphogenesis and NO signaling
MCAAPGTSQTIFTVDDLVDQNIGALVAYYPGATLVFRQYGIGFCCHADQTLGELAKKKGLDVNLVANALYQLPKGPVSLPNPNDTDAFIDFILTRYHQVHRDEIAELVLLARKVEAVHGDHPDVPAGLADELFATAENLDMHMAKEEAVLFPAMREMHKNGVISPALALPIHCMREEHDDHGQAIHRLQELTNNCTVPEGVCGSWRALYSGTGKLIEDLVAHMYLENAILFPQFE